MPLTDGFISRRAVKRDVLLPTEQQVLPLAQILKVNTLHQPAGAPGGKGGQFAPKSMGTGSAGGFLSEEAQAAALPYSLEGSSLPSSLRSREGQTKRFLEISERWAFINNKLQRMLDQQDSPEARTLITEQLALSKELHTLRIDPGTLGLENQGLGMPGGPRDIVIIGAGPGGLAAATHAGVEGYDTLLIDASEQIGGQAKFSARIENVPQAGFPAGISGQKLAQNMLEQAHRSRAETKFGVRVLSIEHDEDTGMKTLTLSDGTTIQSRVVILAGGLRARPSNLPDHKDVFVLDGATLAKEAVGKDAVVVGGSNGAAQSALHTALGARSVALVSRSPLEKGMSEYQRGQILQHPIVDLYEGKASTGGEREVDRYESDGDGNLTAVILKSGERIPAQKAGLFLGGLPNTEWLPESIARSGKKKGTGPQGGHIIVDDRLQTSMPGVFAIGDIRAKNKEQVQSPGRILSAMGDASIAVSNTYAVFAEIAAREKASRIVERNMQRILQQATVRKGEQPAGHWAQVRQRKAAMLNSIFTVLDEAYVVDIENPWYGQTVEPE